MLVKFIAHGTGSAQAAADYLTRETDSQGEVRDDVVVLRGDPDAVAAVSDTVEFEHKYAQFSELGWAASRTETNAQRAKTGAVRVDSEAKPRGDNRGSSNGEPP